MLRSKIVDLKNPSFTHISTMNTSTSEQHEQLIFTSLAVRDVLGY